MADDWDLHAVVRSCTNPPVHIEDPLPELASLTFQNIDNDDDPFYFPDLNTNRPFVGLEEIFNEVYANPQPITPTPSNPVIGGFQNQQLTQPQMIQHHHQIEPQIALPTLHLQTLRPRRRKNQQIKMVHQMTQEQLTTDMWAWRKYGQKPIKGSPYPRNYYRCSTSKGCAARKQVERSISNPAIFVVSYTGEHTHPRPTHRNSQAGNTRTKFFTVHKPKPSCSSSSPASVSNFSPTTPLMEGDESNPHDYTQKETIEIEDATTTT